nr:Chain C, Telomerase reverse transcriptase [Homo sapiens]5MEN_C Chain C, ILE-LEU-ALA-LYS-PHE-LEU-HIS-TRP-LEU [Homo sapiens]
ILAKFLHWL